MKTKTLLLLILFIFFSLSCSSFETLDEKSIKQEIMQVLSAQQVAWNQGDKTEFMQGYAKLDSIRFVSGGTIHYGWDAMLARYNSSYPDKAAMGELTFDILNIEVLSSDGALVFGKYTLVREKDKPWGYFTLLFKRMNDGWKVVHDHTSAADTQESQ